MEDDGIIEYTMESYKRIEDRDDRKFYLIQFIHQNEKMLKETKIDNFRFKASTFAFPVIAAILAIKFGINDPGLFETSSIVLAGLPGIAGSYFWSRSKEKRDNAERELEILKEDYKKILSEEYEENKKRSIVKERERELHVKHPTASLSIEGRISKLDNAEYAVCVDMDVENDKLKNITNAREILEDLKFDFLEYKQFYDLGCLESLLMTKGYNPSEIRFAVRNFEEILGKEKTLERK